MSEQNEVATGRRMILGGDTKPLFSAMSKVQGAIENARKDCNNPFFNSSYADLASVYAACREQLSNHGVSVIQSPYCIQGRAGVETLLAHDSGAYILSTLDLPLSKQDAQGAGSAITYARRYALCAMVGVVQDDDDGNAASEPQKGKGKAQKPPKQDKPPASAAPDGERPTKDSIVAHLNGLGLGPQQHSRFIAHLTMNTRHYIPDASKLDIVSQAHRDELMAKLRPLSVAQALEMAAEPKQEPVV